MINVKHDLEGKYCCRENGEAVVYNFRGQDQYTFKISDIKIESRFNNKELKDEYIIYVRGENTCWMPLNWLIVNENELELLDYIEIKYAKRMLEVKTYKVNC